MEMSSGNVESSDKMQFPSGTAGAGEISHHNNRQWLPDERDGFILWLRGEFAAANAMNDSLCHHLRAIREPGEYDAVIACIQLRRCNWKPVLHMQQYFSIVEVMFTLQQVVRQCHFGWRHLSHFRGHHLKRRGKRDWIGDLKSFGSPRSACYIVAARNTEAANEAKQLILKDIANARVDVLKLDLSSIKSVSAFVDSFNALNLPLNLLINNAGVMFCPFKLSEDGIEMQFATNHLGHFLLTNLLVEKMKETARTTGIEGRIVNLSSIAHLHP